MGDHNSVFQLQHLPAEGGSQEALHDGGAEISVGGGSLGTG